MSREQISKGKLSPNNALETASATPPRINSKGLSATAVNAFGNKAQCAIPIGSHPIQQANNTALLPRTFSESLPAIETNVVKLNLSLPEAYKLSCLKEANRKMFERLSADSLKGMLEHIEWEAAAKIKLQYILDTINANLHSNIKVIVVIDRNSSVDWVFENLLKLPMLDKKLQGRMGMIDHSTDLETRGSLLNRFRQCGSKSLVALIVQSNAVKNGLLDEAVNLNEPNKNRHQITFFDTLRNNPAAVIEFTMLFQVPQQKDPIKMEFMKTDEPNINRHTPL